MAANRKLVVMAMVCVTSIAGLTGCSSKDDAKGKTDSASGKEPTAAAKPKAPVDPFAGLTADQIAEKAVTAMKAAQSIRMAGQVKSDGEPSSVDVAVDTKGSCTGTMGVNGVEAELLRVGKMMYMKGDEKFWRASMTEDGTSKAETDAGVELVKGRWVMMGKDGSKEMGGVCEFEAMTAETSEDKAERTGMTKGPDAEVNGQSVVTLIKKKTNGETITVYVAKEGKPYPLKVVQVGGDEPGTMIYSDYDKPVAAVAPPADQVIDLEKLGG